MFYPLLSHLLYFAPSLFPLIRLIRDLFILLTYLNSWVPCLFAPLVAQPVKNPPAMQETWVPSLGQKDTLEKGMDTHSSILAWRMPWTEEPSGL